MINKVRLYLRINTISDLMMADGIHYDREILKGKKNLCNPQPSYHGYIWPNVDKPTASERAIWSQIMCTHFNIDLITGQGSTTARINKWLPKLITKALWTFSPSSERVYEKQDFSDTCRTWKPDLARMRYRTRTNGRTFVPGHVVHDLPPDTVPISIKINSGKLSIIAKWQDCDRTQIEASGLTSSSPETQLTPLTQTFAYNIIMNNGIIFSDGSYDEGVAAYAIVAQPNIPTSLAEVDYDSVLHDSGTVEGAQGEMNSYCGVFWLLFNLQMIYARSSISGRVKKVQQMKTW